MTTTAVQANDAVKEFKSWFSQYKKGTIDLYQASSVPLAIDNSQSFRYHKTESIQRMDELLQDLVDRNDIAATRLLVEAASFRFDRRPEMERKKHVKKQPWLFRAHSLDALRKITDTKSLAWLRERCLRRDSSWEASFRRVIAASVLGTGHSSDGPEHLIDLLDDRNGDVRAKALTALARVGREADLEAVIRLLEDSETKVRVAAVEAIIGILTHAQNNTPSAAERALAAVIPRLHDTAWPIQDATLFMMEHVRSKTSIPILIDFLEEITSNTESYRELIVQKTLETLRSLTGNKILESDPGKWRAWWNESRSTFQLSAAPLPHIKGYQLDVPYFFNIPVNSDFIYFILDISGSMRAQLTTASGNTSGVFASKIDRARKELLKALSSLDPSVRFNIVLFNDTVMEFSDHPVALTDNALKKAEIFFNEAQIEGGTNIFDALDSALQIKSMGLVDLFGDNLQFDTIFLLSDGVPTAGDVINPEEILRIITEANQLSKIKINTIYLGDIPSRFMRELAEKNFGRHIHIR